MNHKQSDVYRKYRQINQIQFETENQTYSSFAGLVVFQKLFAHLNLKAKLKACFGTHLFQLNLLLQLNILLYQGCPQII